MESKYSTSEISSHDSEKEHNGAFFVTQNDTQNVSIPNHTSTVYEGAYHNQWKPDDTYGNETVT